MTGHHLNFNPRTPCRDATHSRAGGFNRGTVISIHAPRVGMRPLRLERDVTSFWISIHAPRVGMRLRQLVFLSI